MQFESPSNLKNIIALNIKEKVIKAEFLINSNLLGIVFPKSLAIYRIDSNFNKIFEYQERGFGNDDYIVDFAFSPSGQKVCLTFQKGKTICLNIENQDSEKRQTQIFSNSSDPSMFIHWTSTKNVIQTNFDCFRMIKEDQNLKSQKNYLYNYVKPSFSHVFADKGNLLKIQAFEDMMENAGFFTILSMFEQNKKIKLSFDGILEFSETDLSNYFPIELLSNMRYFWLDDYKSLNIIGINPTSDNQFCSLVLYSLDTSNFNQYMREIFSFSWILGNLKESDTNIKLGIFKSRTILKTQKEAFSNWFSETLRHNQDLPHIIKYFAQTGNTKSDDLFNFLKEIDVKMMLNLAENMNKFLKSLFEFFFECIYSQYQRIGAFLRDLKNASIQLKSKNVILLPLCEIIELEVLIENVIQTTEIVIKKILHKKLQIKNFFLFCFKSKFKLSGKTKDRTEHKNFHDAIVDFELLFEFLSSRESMFLDDLNADYNNVCLINVNKNVSSLFTLPKNINQELEVLMTEIGVKKPKNEVIKEQNLGFFQIVNEISSKLKSVSSYFYANSLLIKSNHKKHDLVEKIPLDFKFNCECDQSEKALVCYFKEGFFHVNQISANSQNLVSSFRILTNHSVQSWVDFRVSLDSTFLFIDFEKETSIYRVFFLDLTSNLSSNHKNGQFAKLDMTFNVPEVSLFQWNQKNLFLLNGQNQLTVIERSKH